MGVSCFTNFNTSLKKLSDCVRRKYPETRKKNGTPNLGIISNIVFENPGGSWPRACSITMKVNAMKRNASIPLFLVAIGVLFISPHW